MVLVAGAQGPESGERKGPDPRWVRAEMVVGLEVSDVGSEGVGIFGGVELGEKSEKGIEGIGLEGEGGIGIEEGDVGNSNGLGFEFGDGFGEVGRVEVGFELVGHGSLLS